MRDLSQRFDVGATQVAVIQLRGQCLQALIKRYVARCALAQRFGSAVNTADKGSTGGIATRAIDADLIAACLTAGLLAALLVTLLIRLLISLISLLSTRLV